jgi:hypothetical protein
LESELRYLNLVKTNKLYGSTFFPVIEVVSRERKEEVIIGVSESGLSFIHPITRVCAVLCCRLRLIALTSLIPFPLTTATGQEASASRGVGGDRLQRGRVCVQLHVLCRPILAEEDLQLRNQTGIVLFRLHVLQRYCSVCCVNRRSLCGCGLSAVFRPVKSRS